MYAKVFEQIFDSSIAENYNLRHFFMDLLVLADSDGVVDKTTEAISRRTNIPLELVESYIEELKKPDPKSRSKKEDGKRIIQLDPSRAWGWIIVNYEDYRNLRDEEARRHYQREYMRSRRKSEKEGLLAPVNTCKHLLAHAEAEADTHTEEKKTLNTSKQQKLWFSEFYELYPKSSDKPGCLKLWAELNVNEEIFNQIKEAIAFSIKNEWKDPKFIPLPRNWLSQRRWEDKVKTNGKPEIKLRLAREDI